MKSLSDQASLELIPLYCTRRVLIKKCVFHSCVLCFVHPFYSYLKLYRIYEVIKEMIIWGRGGDLSYSTAGGSSFPVSSNAGSDASIAKYDLKNSIIELWWVRTLLRLQNLLTASQHPHNFLSIWCCSLVVPFIFLEHSDAIFSHSKPLSQLPNRRGPLFRLRLRFLNFFKGAVPPNFHSVVERQLLVVGVQRLEDIFSIVSINLRTLHGSENRWRKCGTT